MENIIWADYFLYVAPALGLVVLFSLLVLAAVPVTAIVTKRKILRNRLYLDEHTRREVARYQADAARLERELERMDRRNRELTTMVRGAMCCLTGIEAETRGRE